MSMRRPLAFAFCSVLAAAGTDTYLEGQHQAAEEATNDEDAFRSDAVAYHMDHEGGGEVPPGVDESSGSMGSSPLADGAGGAGGASGSMGSSPLADGAGGAGGAGGGGAGAGGAVPGATGQAASTEPAGEDPAIKTFNDAETKLTALFIEFKKHTDALKNTAKDGADGGNPEEIYGTEYGQKGEMYEETEVEPADAVEQLTNLEKLVSDMKAAIKAHKQASKPYAEAMAKQSGHEYKCCCRPVLNWGGFGKVADNSKATCLGDQLEGSLGKLTNYVSDVYQVKGLGHVCCFQARWDRRCSALGNMQGWEDVVESKRIDKCVAEGLNKRVLGTPPEEKGTFGDYFNRAKAMVLGRSA
eukprot:TRINITY_DN5845_c0_g1_i1.p1 TRINITY_DN5845_c0_g1~~TRINITY_DN5845_c0_g1_i1.p1  ORF type:complete len:356 (-),score=101.18 TRINITY_DN5845_c0_g1_i1:100-1167(-)